MEKLLSNGIRHQTVPEDYIFPPEKRPGKPATACRTVPVVDLGGETELLGHDRDEIVEQILKAGKEFGFFQVINHGVSVQVITDMMGVAEEFFELPMEDKAKFYSDDPTKIARLGSSGDSNSGGILYWRDRLKLPCYPIEQFRHLWPEKPSDFREALKRYSAEARELASRLLELISEGLGLKVDYFNGDLSGGPDFMNINYYAPCPDPTLTLGLPHHCDPNLITLLLQGKVSGLQIFHEGEWIGVEPLQNAFVVNFGHQLEFITNGMLRSVEHRVVTNSTSSRTSVATFVAPTDDCLIAPPQSMVDERNPPLYRPFLYKEFLCTFVANVGGRNITLESFTIKN